MTTKLDRPLKREIQIEDKAYTLTIDATGLKLVEKGRRNGQEVSWKQVLAADSTPDHLGGVISSSRSSAARTSRAAGPRLQVPAARVPRA